MTCSPFGPVACYCDPGMAQMESHLLLQDPSRAGLDKILVRSILGVATWESRAGGGQKHYCALWVSRERAAVWCSPLAAAL